MLALAANLGQRRPSDGEPLLVRAFEVDRDQHDGRTILLASVVGRDSFMHLELTDGDPGPGECKADP